MLTPRKLGSFEWLPSRFRHEARMSLSSPCYEITLIKPSWNVFLKVCMVQDVCEVRQCVRGETKLINWSRAAPRRGSRTRRDWVSDPAGVAHRPLAPTLPSRDGPVRGDDWAGPYHQRLRPSRPGDPRQRIKFFKYFNSVLPDVHRCCQTLTRDLQRRYTDSLPI